MADKGYEVNHYSGAGQWPDVTTTYYHGDHLGSSRLLTSYNGYPVWQATYLPFGQEWNPQSGVNNYKFTNLERDAESGLDHTWFRQYTSAQGRWLSPDPLGGSVADPQSLNRYAYVLNTPLNLVDPLGLICVIDGHYDSSITSQEDCEKKGGSWDTADTTVTVSASVEMCAVDLHSPWFGGSVSTLVNCDAAQAWQRMQLAHIDGGYPRGRGPGVADRLGRQIQALQQAQPAPGQPPPGTYSQARLAALAQGVQLASPVADPQFIAVWYGVSAVTAFAIIPSNAVGAGLELGACTVLSGFNTVALPPAVCSASTADVLGKTTRGL